MDKIKNFRNKTKSDSSTPNEGFLNKITKRYSNVSSKFLRRSPSRKGAQPVSVGSYDMTGAESEDHRIEIGAPVLISKTYIGDNLLEPIVKSPIEGKSPTDSISSDDVFVDAKDTIITPNTNLGDIQFKFFPDGTKRNPHDDDDKGDTSCNEGSYDVYDPEYETPRSSRTSTLKRVRSKSTSQICRSEMKVHLERVPSLDLTIKRKETVEVTYDFPKQNAPVLVTPENNNNIIEKYTPIPDSDEITTEGVRFARLLFTTLEETDLRTSEEAKNNNNNSLTCDDNNDSGSDSHTPVVYRSHDSLDRTQSRPDVRYSSRESLHSDTMFHDFDLKSVSFESLPDVDHEEEDYISIKDMNWIKEEFDRTANLEYCDHRDRLKPCERRITLLRQKNNSKINVNLGEKKEKLNHAWSGLKSWIGEEKGKIKEVVQRHAAMQRVGATNIIKNQAFFDKMRRDEHKGSATSSQRTSTYSNQNDVSPDKEMEAACENGAAATVMQSTNDLSGRSGSDDQNPNGKKNRIASEISEGQNGFEELRRYVKQGGDFGKDLVAILQERIDAEQLYAKSLSKMACKLNKSCREIPGSVADAWRGVATEMESRSEVHRQFSSSLNDDIVKPLKNILDNQHKTRKSIESNVDKASRVLTDWRVSETKSKKSSHTAARENEKLQDALLDVRITRSPSVGFLHHNSTKTLEKDSKVNEKDCAKLDNKRKKAEDAVKRADVEYYTICIRSERARVDWEMSVLRGSSVLQSLENQRLSNLKNYVTSYLKLSADMNPLLEKVVERLQPSVNACNTQKDMIVVRNIRRASEGPSEQLLPDFYCEHTTLGMNRDRRKQSLVKLLQLVRQDLERERRSRNGMKELSATLTGNENQNLADKLYHIRSMLTYLEGARYKLQSALFELDHKPRGSHPLAPHIQITRDRTGLQQSILKVPLWLKNSEDENENQNGVKDNNGSLNGDHEDEELDDCTENRLIAANQTKNEALIKKFTNTFGRSKSNMEFSGSIIELPPAASDKSNTLSDKSNATDSPTWDRDRGIADGNSNQPDSDFDEFSSQDEEEDSNRKPIVISKCKALYSYTPKLYDELELTPGDIIEVYNKQEDGWWQGATKTKVGIFPATYVEEIA